jgi:hypothetical protein
VPSLDERDRRLVQVDTGCQVGLPPAATQPDRPKGGCDLSLVHRASMVRAAFLGLGSRLPARESHEPAL